MSHLIRKANYFLSQSTHISELCDSLFSVTGIIGFLFLRFFNDGSIIALTNHGQYLDWHLQNEYLITPIAPADVISEKFIIMSTPEEMPNYAPVLDGMRNNFGYSHPFSIVEKNANHIDAYCFVTSTAIENNINLYLNSLGILEKFKIDFKEKMSKFLEKSRDKRIFLPECMWPTISNPKNIKDILAMSNQTSVATLDTKKIFYDPSGNEVLLSKQQLKVMSHLAAGLTIKEIANSMSLSSRTIEHYLENIKQKFGCYKKSDLLNCLRNKTHD